jgi:hypothetical protein
MDRIAASSEWWTDHTLRIYSGVLMDFFYTVSSDLVQWLGCKSHPYLIRKMPWEMSAIVL